MAKPVRFPQVNVIFGKDQPGVQPLPAHVENVVHRPVHTLWELDDDEIEEITRTRQIWVTVQTHGQALQPLYIGGGCPLPNEANAPLN
jgi:hypothetical protein